MKFQIFILLVSVMLAGCLDFKNTASNQQKKSMNNALAIEDKNKNDLWDDIEPFISKYTKDDSIQRKALEYEFRSFQKILLNPELGTKIKYAAIREKNRQVPILTGQAKDSSGESLQPDKRVVVDFMLRAAACRRKFLPSNRIDSKKIEAAILSNSARVEAYNKYNLNLSGGVYELWDEARQGDPCPQEPNFQLLYSEH